MFNIIQAKKPFEMLIIPSTERENKGSLYIKDVTRRVRTARIILVIYFKLKGKSTESKGSCSDKCNVAPTSPGKGMLSCFVQEIFFPCLFPCYVSKSVFTHYGRTEALLEKHINDFDEVPEILSYYCS